MSGCNIFILIINNLSAAQPTVSPLNQRSAVNSNNNTQNEGKVIIVDEIQINYQKSKTHNITTEPGSAGVLQNPY